MLTAQKSIKQEILSKLNEEQRQPVIDYHGPSIVAAAPGSGKTHVLISRAAYMIEEGVDPNSILMFTFTRKGANEIKERVESRIGPKANGVTIGTYHSFCMRLLRRYADYLGWRSNFSIYDEEDKKKVLHKIVIDKEYVPGIVANQISRWKDHMISPAHAKMNAETPYERQIAVYYEQYQQTMKAQNAFDFDDLIYFAIRLFERYPNVQTEVNRHYQYVIADEFQDSSERDIELLLHLSGKQMNICLVLDDEQSIYGFRGANIKSVFTLIENIDFKHFTLSRNYRSTQTIVSAARSVIENNSMQLEKTVFTQNEKGDKIVYYELPDTNAEALQVVKVIMALTRLQPPPGKNKIKPGDIAILYRMSYLSRSIEEYLLKNGIQYTIVGGAPFYARKEIKDILAYVRFLINPSDQQAFLRIINTPKRKLGAKATEHVIDCFYRLNHVNIDANHLFMQACNDVQLKLKGLAKKGMENFIATIAHLNDFIHANESSPKQVIEEIVRVTKYADYLMESEKENAEDKIANIAELAEIASSYSSLDDFIANMVLNNADDTTENAEEYKVKLLTMHSSKGLEFPIVIIAGANEGIVPHHKADTLESIEEERRLFYVAMTRAEKNLFITRSKVMPMNGVPYHYKSSRFVEEIDSKYIRWL